MLRENKHITAVLIGAGPRGSAAYISQFRPDVIKLVGVAEKDDYRRNKIKDEYSLDEDLCFKSYEELFNRERIADLAIICTNDRQHVEPAEAAAKLGYHILLEKPISPVPEEVYRIGKLAEGYDKVISICHVLRYTPFFKTIKKLLDEGKVGRLMTINHNENVAYWFHTQNFVRGNWRSSKETSPMILAKSCHDMDILLYLVGADCIRLSSFGSLSHFKAENAPKGAAKRCLDGCPYFDTCQYNAVTICLNPEIPVRKSCKNSFNIGDTSEGSIINALKTNKYGRCVYYCDNDVVDHQVVNMEFENEVTAVFTMTGFTYDHSRTIKLMGTDGEIGGDLDRNEITVKDFKTRAINRIVLPEPPSGHSGGDMGIVESTINAIRGTGIDNSSAKVSVQSHMMAFAAEKSRNEGKTIDMREYINSLSKGV